jgi:hypothetical protein
MAFDNTRMNNHGTKVAQKAPYIMDIKSVCITGASEAIPQASRFATVRKPGSTPE